MSKLKNEPSRLLPTNRHTKENGKSALLRDMAKEDVCGLMGASIKDFGKGIWPMGMGELFMLTGIYMKGSGKMIRRMATEFTLNLTEPNTTENGLKICKMVMVLKNGQMVHISKELINQA